MGAQRAGADPLSGRCTGRIRRRLAAGAPTFTRNSRKIYTNGHALGVGSRVYDPESGVTYTVTGDLDHGAIHPLRRFVVERKGEAAPK